MSLLTKITRGSITKSLLKSSSQIRHSHAEWTYRSIQEPKRWSKVGATVVATIAYWWFYWNLYHDFDVIRGYYGGKPLPNPAHWTDEELGIPPDDQGLNI